MELIPEIVNHEQKILRLSRNGLENGVEETQEHLKVDQSL